MSTISTHELAYDVALLLERRFKSKGIPKPKQLAEEITPDIIRIIPSEAFDPTQAWRFGKLFFHGDVDDEHVLDVQYEILTAHHNLKDGMPITLYLSSFGGDVFAGLALASTIQEVRRAGRKVNIHIQGYAMSMGSLIAQVGDHRTIESSGWLMLHNIASYVGRHIKTPFIEDEAETSVRLEHGVFSLYTARTGKPTDYWRKKMHKRDWYLTAEEALEEGLVDEIITPPAFPRQRRKKAA